MPKSKDYKEELRDLEFGLKNLEQKKPTRFLTHEKIRHAKEVQEARIDFFKRGYAMRDREIINQQKLNLENGKKGL